MSGTVEPVAKETESLKKYATRLFESSLVNGLPQIVQTVSIPRKIFKITVLTLCFIGFIYQTSEFMKIILSYPSVVDIRVEYPSFILSPAVTFCNTNSIRRTKYCEKYPDYCEKPENMTEFCTRFPHYCRNLVNHEDFKIPIPEAYSFEKNITKEILEEMGHSPEVFVKKKKFYFVVVKEDQKEEETFGPLVYPKEPATAYNHPKLFGCHSLLSRVNSSEESTMLEIEMMSAPVMHFKFDFESEEYFRPDRIPSGLMAIHSPYVAVNPYENGFHMRPGKDYKVHVTMTEEQLLPYPYPSDCTNYTENWINNGRRGPRSKEMCVHECFLKVTTKYCNCTMPFVLYPHEEEFCQNTSCFRNRGNELISCNVQCKEDCHFTKFSYEFQERFREKANVTAIDEKQIRRTSNVDIFIKNPEVVIFKYRPQYQDVEVFSYLGGYIGAWLGISLVAVLDFMETLILIIGFCIQRRRKSSKK